MSAAEIVRRFIIQRIIPEDRGHSTPCWNWRLGLSEKGYAKAEIPTLGKNVRVHRASYEAYIGPIADGLQIDHLCRNKACVNPAHLEPVTQDENVRRAMRTHCKNGHEYIDGSFTVINGARRCHACPNAKESRPPRTHCPNGHPYPDEDQVSRGAHRCQICLRAKRQREQGKVAAEAIRRGGRTGSAATFRIAQGDALAHHSEAL